MTTMTPAPGRLDVRRAGLITVTVLVVLANLAPFVWMVATSLKTRIETQQPQVLLPRQARWDNYTELFTGTSPVLTYLQNSLISAAVATVVTMALAVPAAYALARIRMRGARDLQFGIISIKMMPQMAILVPISIAFAYVGLTRSLAGLIIVLILVNASFAVWLLSIFFSQLPSEVEEAGMLDGLSRWGVLWRIAVPLTRTSILVIATFVFIFSWNELPFALVLTQQDTATLPVFLSSFASQTSIAYHTMAAVGVVQLIPVVLLTFMIQRHIVRGLSFGAVK